MASQRYILISPCRDEAAYLQTTINSVVQQTVLPTRWIIVDDGSTDGSTEILAKAAQQYSFIQIIRREDRGKRLVGPGVIDAFYAGLAVADLSQYDYVCKLDVDLDIPAMYFGTLMQRMEVNPRIGTCSGKPYFYDKHNELVSECCGDETSVGMIKFYRVSCFQQINGFVREVMWDGIDCHRCRMLGWIACSWDDPMLRFIHLRPMGSSDKGILTGRIRHGSGQYFMGTGFFYMLASAIFRMTRPPLVWGGVAMMYGYLKSLWQRRVRYDDPEFRAFLRRYQWSCLWMGKARATQLLQQQYLAGSGSSQCSNADSTRGFIL
jgi:biofilm PGA synthesis N-glycosyltransferase PgaC